MEQVAVLVHFKLGWGSWAGAGLRDLDVFVWSAPCPWISPLALAWLFMAQQMARLCMGWSGSPCKWGFSHLQKSCRGTDLYCADFHSKEQICRELKPVPHCMRETFVNLHLFSLRGFVCFFFCHRFSRDGCGTSAMAPFVFTCKSKQLAMLIKELF